MCLGQRQSNVEKEDRWSYSSTRRGRNDDNDNDDDSNEDDDDVDDDDDECVLIFKLYFSYGGMLSAFMRFKYPNVIDVALAASAPIYMVTFKGIEREFFFSAVTEVI